MASSVSDATRKLEPTLEPCPESKEVDASRAECYFALGNIAQARQSLRKSLKQDPDFLEALVLEGTILLSEGNAKESLAVLERAVGKYPKDYTAHFKLQQAYTQAGDTERAAAENATAKQIRALREEFATAHQDAWDHPQDRNVRLRLAAMAQQLDMPEIANDWLKAANALVANPAPESERLLQANPDSSKNPAQPGRNLTLQSAE